MADSFQKLNQRKTACEDRSKDLLIKMNVLREKSNNNPKNIINNKEANKGSFSKFFNKYIQMNTACLSMIFSTTFSPLVSRIISIPYLKCMEFPLKQGN